MRTVFFLNGLVGLGLLAAGCGGGEGTDAGRDTPISDVPSQDAPTSMDVPRTDVPGATDTPGGTDVPSSTDAPLADARDVPSRDAAGVRVAISGFEAYGNCMPIVPPDPIIATWVVDVSGATGTEARFVSGELVFSGGTRVAVTVDVPTFPLRGGVASQPQRREMLTTPTGACGMCGSMVSVTAELVYEVDGATFSVTATSPFSCAF